MSEQLQVVPEAFQIALDDTFQQGLAQGLAQERVRVLMHLAVVYGRITDAENAQYRTRLEALVLDAIPNVPAFLEGLQAVEPADRPQATRRFLDWALAPAPDDSESDDTNEKR